MPTGRAHARAGRPAVDTTSPTWALGAADVHIFVLRDRRHPTPTTAARRCSSAARARRGQRDERQSMRTITAGSIDYRVVAVPTTQRRHRPGPRPEHGARRSASLQKMGAVMLLFGLAGVIGAAFAGWGVARNGLRPVRRLTENVEVITRTEDLTPAAGGGRRRDRPPRDGVQRAARLALRVPRPSATAGRRRRPRAAYAAHLAAHQPRPAAPVRRRGRSRPGRARGAARRRRRPDRGDVQPRRRPRRAGARRAATAVPSSRSTSPRWSTGRSPGPGDAAPV